MIWHMLWGAVAFVVIYIILAAGLGRWLIRVVTRKSR